MSANNIQKNKRSLQDMPGGWYTKLVSLCYSPSSYDNDRVTYTYISNYLKRNDIPFVIDKNGNIIATKGHEETQPLFCCHIDTVHDWPENLKIHLRTKEHKYLFASDNGQNYGIGGDDKCGVFVCLYLLETLENCKCIFFTGEESGCTGSYGIDIKHIEGARFICSVDRWGNSDLITTYSGKKTVSKSFIKDVSPLLRKYNYKEATGLLTDCFTLMDRGAGISCFNISCGYYSHHSSSEIIDINELWQCSQMCLDIANVCGGVYSHKIEYKPLYADKFSKKSTFDFSDIYSDESYGGGGDVPLVNWEKADLIKEAIRELCITTEDLYFDYCLDEVTEYVNFGLSGTGCENIKKSDVERFRDNETSI